MGITSGHQKLHLQVLHSVDQFQFDSDPLNQVLQFFMGTVEIYRIALLATNMRTSVEVIERWYSKVIPADQARILRGDVDWE